MLEDIAPNKPKDSGLTDEQKLLYKERRRLEDGASKTNRDLKSYEEYLNIDFSNMPEGTLILDIGTGLDGIFQKEAAAKGLKVVSIGTGIKGGVRTDEFKANSKGLAVAARVQEMPFPDNTFDYEFALFSVPYYSLENMEEYKLWMNEIVRTLKPGGIAAIAPVFDNEYSKIYSILRQENRVANFKVGIIPSHLFPKHRPGTIPPPIYNFKITKK